LGRAAAISQPAGPPAECVNRTDAVDQLGAEPALERVGGAQVGGHRTAGRDHVQDRGV
jgi:hypothetical protein